MSLKFRLLHNPARIPALLILLWEQSINFVVNMPRRRRAEKERLASEIKFREIFNNSIDAIGVSRTGIHEFVNPAYASLFGYASGEEISGRPVLELIAPSSRAEIGERIKRRAAGQSVPDVFETMGLRKDGSEFVMDVHASSYSLFGVVYTLVIIRDITAFKREEREKIALAEIGRLIGSTLNIEEVYGRFVKEVKKLIPLDRLVVNLNDPRQAMLTCVYVHGEEVAGRRQGERFPLAGSVNAIMVKTRKGLIIQAKSEDEIAAGYPSVVSTFLAGMHSMMSVPLIAGDEVIGGLHFRAIKPDAYTDNDLRSAERIAMQISGAIANAQIYNDLITTERDLRESEEKYRILFNNDRAAIYIFDADTLRFLDVNEAYIRLYGYSREELLGRMTALDTSAEPEESAKAVREAADGTIFIPLRWHKKKDGTVFPVEVIGGIYLWKGRRAMFGMARDISERRRLDEERLAMERQMLHSQKLESLGVLAGGIAHDFNNLLMTILGNLELAMDDISESSKVRHYLENTNKAARRAAHLTRQMLAYSGKGHFVVEDINLGELVQDNIHIFRSSIPATITLKLDLATDIPPIMADAGQIQQVVMNLITNAAEAIGDSAGMITLSTGCSRYDEKHLRSSRLQEKPVPGEFVHLDVADTGCGMDEETQAKMFEPFFTTKFTGRGLGMSAMQGIILGHKGAIFMESRVGKGTTIRVIFPVSDTLRKMETPIASAKQETHQPPEGAAEKGLVLIVDDEDDVRDICGTMLARIGYRTLTASDGEEAVQIFRSRASEIACVILDLMMPKMDGHATFGAMKQVDQNVKVILSSGYTEEAIAQRFAGLGLAGFIQKPYQVKQLRQALDRVIKGDQRQEIAHDRGGVLQ